MSVNFHSIGSNPSYTCCICRQRSEEDLQAHNDLHAMHKECIKLWAKTHSTCPVCRVDVDPSSLFTWKERIIQRLENVDIENFIADTILNCPSAYLGAYMADSSLDRTGSEEPPVSMKVFLIATAIGALTATRFRRGQNHAALIHSYSVVYAVRSLYPRIVNFLYSFSA